MKDLPVEGNNAALEAEVYHWRESKCRTAQGKRELTNYLAYQQELRTNRALQARLDEP